MLTYQELVKTYPWVSIALEVFKGVAPTLVSILAIFITQYCIKKREMGFKKKEMHIEYLEKVLNYIVQIRVNIFDVSSMIEKSLREKNPEVRLEKCNEVTQKINAMNLSVATWNDTYDSVTTAFGYKIGLNRFKESMNKYTKEMIQLRDKYVVELDINNSIKEINFIQSEVIQEIDLCINLLSKQINRIYK